MIGVYYYPEQWAQEQWDRDIQNISRLGMKHIHLAEFSWIHLQPEENRFDFSWLDKIVELADANGLKIILCTPTATPPIWLSENYPETLMVKENLAKVTHGSRAQRCVNSPKFIKLSEIITKTLGERYGRHSAVMGWQIDNEIGHYENNGCYCDSCHCKFIDYLRERYVTIDNLNKNWAGDFWSQNYLSFDQVELPNPHTLPYLPNEHALLDFKRFFSMSLSRYLEDQAEVLRQSINDKMWITHNFMANDTAHFPGHVKKGLDVYTLTIYPVAGFFHGQQGRELHRIGNPYNISLNHDKMKSYNGRWGVMEQQPGQVNWGPHNLRPYPGSTRLWLWTAIAHGAEILDTYRYRQPLGGSEQYHEGVVGLDGVSLSRGGEDFVQVAAELQKIEHLLNVSPPTKQNRVAICIDWDSLTALSIHPQNEMFSPYACLEHFYTAFKKLGLNVDIIYSSKPATLQSYNLVCTVLVDLASDAFMEKITEYVNEGGHIILSPRNFSRDPNGHFPERTYGSRLEALTGCVFDGYDVMVPGHNGIIEMPSPGKSVFWQSWAEQVVPPAESESMAFYADQFYQGLSASFTVKKGKGRISYIGFDEETGITDLVENYAKFTYPHCQRLPDNTIFMKKGAVGVFLNYNDHSEEVPDYLLQNGKVVIGSTDTKPADLAVISYAID